MFTPKQRRLLKKFAKFLKNPKLKQTKSALRGDNGAKCCLGHLCEFYRKETGKGRWRNDNGMWYFFASKDDYDYQTLPNTVREFFGLNGPNPTLLIGDEEEAAAVWNDQVGLSLAEISKGFAALVK